MIENYSSSLVSQRRADNITGKLNSLSSRNVLTGSTSGFDNEQLVMDAHKAITHMGLRDRFLDWAFHGGTKAEALDALATLMLYKQAQEAGANTSLIPGNRNDALATLARVLSPSGQDELLPSVPDNLADDEFSQYLTTEDRYDLAGHVHLKEGRFAEAGQAYLQAGQLVPAARAYELVAKACLQGDQAESAARAYGQAADAYWQGGQSEQATDAYELAAKAYLQAGQLVPAADAYWRAGDGYEGMANAYYLQAGRFQHAKDTFSEAGDAFWTSMDLYKKVGRNEHAQQAHVRAVSLYESARVSRRPFCLSHAPMADPAS